MNKKILAIASSVVVSVLLIYQDNFATNNETSINATENYLGSWVHSEGICEHELSVDDLHEVTFVKGIETLRAGMIDVDSSMVINKPLLPNDFEQYRAMIERVLATCPSFNLDFETATEITVSRPSSTQKFIYFGGSDVLLNVSSDLPKPQLLLSSKYLTAFEILD